MQRRSVAVVGGGFSGLAAAYYLQILSEQAETGLEIDLLERRSHLGGVVGSYRDSEFLLEKGPEAFASYYPDFTELVDALGLTDDLLSPTARGSQTFCYDGRRLWPVPAGILAFRPPRLTELWRLETLSKWGKTRTLVEPFIPASRGDLTVDRFFRRRLGADFTDQLVLPLISAIYGADPTELSARSTLPLLFRLEKKHGSLWRAMGARRRGSSANGSFLLTFKEGMQQLIDALAGRLDSVQILTDTGSLQLQEAADGVCVQGRQFDKLYQAVLLCTPAFATADIVAKVLPETARLLKQVRYRSVRIVYLAYPRAAVGHPLDGSGFLVHPSAGLQVRACTWVSSKFEGRCPPDSVLLRCSVQPADPGASVESTIAQAHRELRNCLSISGEPSFRRCFEHPSASPVTVLGHAEILAEVLEQFERHGRLFLAGSFVAGSGLPECAATARRAATSLLKRLTKGKPSERSAGQGPIAPEEIEKSAPTGKRNTGDGRSLR